MVGAPAFVNFPCIIKSRESSFLLVPAHPGSPGKGPCVCCVCVWVSRADNPGEGAVMACLHRRNARLHIHSLIYHEFPRWFPTAFPAIFIFFSVLLLWYVLPNCRGFHLTSLSLASSQLLMQTLRGWLVRCYQVTHTQSQHLGRFVIQHSRSLSFGPMVYPLSASSTTWTHRQ